MLRLPLEILCNIFSYSTVSELFKLRQVCTRFEQVIYSLIDFEIKVEESLHHCKCQVTFSIIPNQWDLTNLAKKLTQVSYEGQNLSCWLLFTTKITIDMSSLDMTVVEEFLRYFHNNNFDFKLAHICIQGFWPVYHINSHLSLLHYIEYTYSNCNTSLQICLSKEFEKSIKDRNIKLKLWPSVKSLTISLYGSCRSSRQSDNDFSFFFDLFELPLSNDLHKFIVHYYAVAEDNFQIQIDSDILSRALINCSSLENLALYNVFVSGSVDWAPRTAKLFTHHNVVEYSCTRGSETLVNDVKDLACNKDYLLSAF